MAQVFARGQSYYVRFRHNGKDYCRSTGVKLPRKGASKEERLAAMDKAEARLDAMLAEIRGRAPIEELFARLVEALEIFNTASKRLKGNGMARIVLSAALLGFWELTSSTTLSGKESAQ